MARFYSTLLRCSYSTVHGVAFLAIMVFKTPEEFGNTPHMALMLLFFAEHGVCCSFLVVAVYFRTKSGFSARDTCCSYHLQDGMLLWAFSHHTLLAFKIFAMGILLRRSRSSYICDNSCGGMAVELCSPSIFFPSKPWVFLGPSSCRLRVFLGAVEWDQLPALGRF